MASSKITRWTAWSQNEHFMSNLFFVDLFPKISSLFFLSPHLMLVPISLRLFTLYPASFLPHVSSRFFVCPRCISSNPALSVASSLPPSPTLPFSSQSLLTCYFFISSPSSFLTSSSLTLILFSQFPLPLSAYSFPPPRSQHRAETP